MHARYLYGRAVFPARRVACGCMQTEELASKFSLDRITKSAAVFDKVKFSWMNGQHIKMLPEAEVGPAWVLARLYACA